MHTHICKSTMFFIRERMVNYIHALDISGNLIQMGRQRFSNFLNQSLLTHVLARWYHEPLQYLVIYSEDRGYHCTRFQNMQNMNNNMSVNCTWENISFYAALMPFDPPKLWKVHLLNFGSIPRTNNVRHRILIQWQMSGWSAWKS